MDAETDAAELAALAAAQAGAPDAFAVLVARHEEAAFRLAVLLLHDAASAQDVVQEALLRAHRALPRFRAGEPFRPWLLQIVANAAKNELRSRGRRRNLFERLTRSAGPEAAPGPERALIASERSALVLEALNRLSVDDRTVLYLRFFLDLSERELAVALGRPPGTVKSRLSRASGRLRTLIAERYPSLLPSAFEEVLR